MNNGITTPSTSHHQLRGILAGAILLLAVVALCLPASAQSCSLCYTQAASAGARMVQALRSGILVLIFPPMAICIGITVMSYKKRNRFNGNESDRGSDLGW